MPITKATIYYKSTVDIYPYIYEYILDYKISDMRMVFKYDIDGNETYLEVYFNHEGIYYYMPYQYRCNRYDKLKVYYTTDYPE